MKDQQSLIKHMARTHKNTLFDNPLLFLFGSETALHFFPYPVLVTRRFCVAIKVFELL